MNLFRRYLCFLFLGTILYAQEHPPIQVYTSKDYAGETQNWSISQDIRNYIYVANNKGLLEFNGAEWRLYESPNKSILRSVHVIDDLIYTGCNGDFGYWEKDESGQLIYNSLSKTLEVPLLEDEEFWNIINVDNYILFQSLKRIYIYNTTTHSFHNIDSNTIIYKIFEVDGKIYFQNTEEGLFVIDKGESKLVSDHPVLMRNRLVNVFIENNTLLLETENDGFYTINGTQLTKWNIPGNMTLEEVSVFRSIRLKDGSYMLGTRSNGILHLTKEGLINFKINVVNGLSNNTIHWIYEDNEQNIWLALENGINCINMSSPFRIYEDDKGKIGTINTSILFNDLVYVGTNQGLFFKENNSDSAFTNIETIQEAVWQLTEINGVLFCGHDTGTSIIDQGTTKKVVGINQGTWNLKPIDSNNELILQGNYDGLYVLQNVEGDWVIRNKIEGFDLSSRFFEYFDDHIFVNHEYKGVFKIEVDKGFRSVIDIKKLPVIDKELHSSIIKYKNDLLLGFREGVFKYDIAGKKFIRDSVLSQLFDGANFTSGKLIPVKETNTLWAFSERNLSYLSLNNLSGSPRINKIPWSKALPKGLTGYENVSYLDDNSYLIGTSTGFVLLDLDKIKEKTFHVEINTIHVSTLKGATLEIFNNGNSTFENQYNNFRFHFNVAEFDKYVDTEYQYKLKGFQEDWSNWSDSPVATYENLPFGSYNLNVRARVGNTITENVASYSFSIQRPWLLSNTMIAAYALVLIILSFVVHNVYKRYYRKQRERLLLKTERELELKELENKQQLMRFNNDKLRQDIENKNRELGISTMSLIKKNEFLNNLKKELQNVDDPKRLKHVIKIIDRNLNNTDDWNLFEEAFNNADKDFLKKIKELHPALTSNDLRLCAYLRLNLSSKEIAPLLNISPRSVEVKRYRLRKKMDLAHEASLSDYILEI
ncbi:triple tyrosine motif-containing protein [Aestuariivivens sediminicola]|uniref:triple tyrosine motif-containing protein n=1 Tax=Aestuariivivens sediminicola TaxID=2913560 RepID=UPI001F591D61|nr:triple tyrosine motif-containing protein [Aestuariivivens sediminicola]